MIHLLKRTELPKNIVLAFSGGADSVSGLKILKKFRYNITLAYFNHGTEHGQKAEDFIRTRYYQENLIIGQYVPTQKTGSVSQENEWRKQRYRFLRSLLDNTNGIVTCHHLDDVVETWIFSTFHGEPKIIPFCTDRVYRPFLLTTKKDLREDIQEEEYIEDPSNEDTVYMRNFIRKNIAPYSFRVNPGLYKVLRKKYVTTK